MDVVTRKSGEILSIRIAGAIDESAAEALKTELGKIAREKPKKVVMDLSLVPTIGSSGIGKILMFYKSLDSMKSEFEIKGVQENIFNLFKAIKLDRLFSISLK